MTQVSERESIEERLARIEGYQAGLSKRMDDLRDSVNQRFQELRDGVDKRFEAVDKRFDGVDKRFDDMNKRFSLLTWTITGWFTLLTVLVVVFKFIG